MELKIRCAYEHVSDKVTGREAEDEANGHTSKDGDDSLMDSANPFDLEVIRCKERKNEQDAENTQSPSKVSE